MPLPKYHFYDNNEKKLYMTYFENLKLYEGNWLPGYVSEIITQQQIKTTVLF